MHALKTAVLSQGFRDTLINRKDPAFLEELFLRFLRFDHSDQVVVLYGHAENFVEAC